MNRRSRAVVAALLLTVAPFAGCGDDEPENAAVSSSTAPTSSEAPSDTDATPTAPIPTTARKVTARSLGPCLLTKAAVSDAIAGTWRVSDQRNGGCNFSSDRGAQVGVQRLEKMPGEDRNDLIAGLASARTSCSAKAREVPAIGAFACLEKTDTGELIVGNVIGGDDLWVVILPAAPGGGDHAPELDAMVAILSQLPPA